MMIVFFLMIILATGVAIDLAKHEVRRTVLQSAVDRGALAAASLRQTLANDADGNAGELERMVQDYVATAIVETGPWRLTVDETINLNSRDVYVAAEAAVWTNFMSMAGYRRLGISVETRAVEAKPELEISMIFDTSGSMARDRLTGASDPGKLNNFKIAAGRFVDDMLSDNDDDRVSISLVQYDWHVNPGPWMFERVVGSTPSAGQGSCYSIELGADLTDNPGTIPGLDNGIETPPRQIVDAYRLDLEGVEPFFAREPARWVYSRGRPRLRTNICPADSVGATTYFEDDADPLFEAIGVDKINDEIVLTSGGIQADGSTTTYFGLQWGLALLNPVTQPIISEMAAPSVDLVESSFSNRPKAWLAEDTVKAIVLLTDGMMNVQADFYTPPGFSSPTGVPRQNQVETAFRGLCDWAKVPERNVVIFTIAYDTTEQAAELMNYCASEGFAFRADQGNIDAVFDQISSSIQTLRLSL